MQLGLNSLGFEGIVLVMALYFIVVPTFCFSPFGFDMGPGALQRQRVWTSFLRISINVLSVYWTAFVWEVHTEGPSSFSPESVIKEIEESDLFMKIVYLLMSHFILFNLCRSGINACRIVMAAVGR